MTCDWCGLGECELCLREDPITGAPCCCAHRSLDDADDADEWNDDESEATP